MMHVINNELVDEVPDDLPPDGHDEPTGPCPCSARGTGVVDL